MRRAKLIVEFSKVKWRFGRPLGDDIVGLPK